RKGRVSLYVRAQSLRRALVERYPIGFTLGELARRGRCKLLPAHADSRAFPASLLAGPVVLRVAGRTAVQVSDIENGLLAPVIVQGCHPVRTAVHDRMIAG